MKTKISNYVFNKASKQITFSDYSSIRLDSVLLITNVTDNIIIYNFADATKGGTVSSNILTLGYDTSLMDDSDKLQIFYEDENKSEATEESVGLLKRIAKVLESIGTVDRLNRQRVTLDALQLASGSTTTELAGTVPVSGTVAMTNLGAQPGAGGGSVVGVAPPYQPGNPFTQVILESPVDQRSRVAEDSHISYQLGIRNKLSFS